MSDRPIRRAVYAGSFDPPTNGHLWMIREAQALFDELIVAIGVNPDKKATYSVTERETMLRTITAEFPNVRIGTFTNQFLVNYAKSLGAAYVVRGIRTASDYEYERAMRYINHDLQPNISTVLLMPPREFAEVSSTMVKGMVGPDNWQTIIRRYVPDAVYQKLIQDHQQKKM
ncbi:pantetheine-phosphate adenylyltransferase [Stenoxybacter acetivorans]|uniref:pantetheine-phosphate adenylyltransferase n=1 Tax=Stenoxybacter acetivorans TaxID=422441 RepID=UPI000568BFC8|nr:pantetheine-phosphate adenylyltransferase [Stenoxybacter acetivorans]